MSGKKFFLWAFVRKHKTSLTTQNISAIIAISLQLSAISINPLKQTPEHLYWVKSKYLKNRVNKLLKSGTIRLPKFDLACIEYSRKKDYLYVAGNNYAASTSFHAALFQVSG